MVLSWADTVGEGNHSGPRSDKNTPSARRGGNHTTMMSDSSASLGQLGPGSRERLHDQRHNGCYTITQTARWKSAAVTHKSDAPAFAQNCWETIFFFFWRVDRVVSSVGRLLGLQVLKYFQFTLMLFFFFKKKKSFKSTKLFAHKTQILLG